MAVAARSATRSSRPGRVTEPLREVSVKLKWDAVIEPALVMLDSTLSTDGERARAATIRRRLRFSVDDFGVSLAHDVVGIGRVTGEPSQRLDSGRPVDGEVGKPQTQHWSETEHGKDRRGSQPRIGRGSRPQHRSPAGEINGSGWRGCFVHGEAYVLFNSDPGARDNDAQGLYITNYTGLCGMQGYQGAWCQDSEPWYLSQISACTRPTRIPVVGLARRHF